jgi:hypothetical protein
MYKAKSSVKIVSGKNFISQRTPLKVCVSAVNVMDCWIEQSGIVAWSYIL